MVNWKNEDFYEGTCLKYFGVDALFETFWDDCYDLKKFMNGDC